MATYSSVDYSTNAPIAIGGITREGKTYYYSITTTAALTTADVLNFGYVPPNFRLVDAILKPSDLDTNGTPTLTLNVGDSGSANRIFAASTSGQTGVADRTNAYGSIGFKFTTKTLITGAPAANAATGVAGTIELILRGYVEDSATS